jgi:limonene-1,2-epoxide hydrolase
MKPLQLIENWVSAFNRGDADELATFYAEDAVNHQVVTEPVYGRDAIRDMFAKEFGRANMVCQIENLFQDGDWAILEWSDPLGLRGCGFFHIKNEEIVFQRGYFDRLTFLKIQGLPIE